MERRVVPYSEASGRLEGSSGYLIRIPENWNGVLLNDLDYAGGGYTPTSSRNFILDRGYGLSGTSRLQTTWGRSNLDNQLSVLEIVTRTFGAPRSIIQIGCSGGGATALMMAEQHADRIHGAVAMCGTSPAVYYQIWTDLLFVAKAILAPDSAAMVLGRQESEAIPDFASPELAAWSEILQAAEGTAIGRARIALIVALSQLPTWGGGVATPTLQAPPDPTDIVAVQASMAETLTAAVTSAVGLAHGPAAGTYSNADVDFVGWYGNADPAQRQVVEALYEDVEGDRDGLIREDLARLVATPRLDRDRGEKAPEWLRPNSGRPGVPILHATTMDVTTPPAVTVGYGSRVRSNGFPELYRSAFVARANHCGFSVSEVVTLVGTLLDRVDSGFWSDTRADALNRRAAALGVDDSRFVDYPSPLPNRPVTSSASSPTQSAERVDEA